jgi:hypothetical protein
VGVLGFFMELLPHEKIIDEHEWTTLTNKSVVQEKESFFGNLSYTEIPIDKIDSISRIHVFRKIFLFLALFFWFFGGYNYYQESPEGLVLVSAIIGGLSFLFYFVTASKNLIIKGGNEIIIEEARGAGKFVRKLRHEIYS